MRMRSLLVAGAATAALFGTTAGPALADDAPPPVSTTATITNVHTVQLTGANLVAIVRFDYKCVGDATSDHLFVAVKQGPDVTVGSSSSDAQAFYSTNWLVDRGPNKLICDNQTHHMHAILLPDLQFFLANHAAKLLNTRSQAFLQICLFDSTGLATDYTMKDVNRTGVLPA